MEAFVVFGMPLVTSCALCGSAVTIVASENGSSNEIEPWRDFD